MRQCTSYACNFTKLIKKSFKKNPGQSKFSQNCERDHLVMSPVTGVPRTDIAPTTLCVSLHMYSKATGLNATCAARVSEKAMRLRRRTFGNAQSADSICASDVPNRPGLLVSTGALLKQSDESSSAIPGSSIDLR